MHPPLSLDIFELVFTYCLPREPSFSSGDAPSLITHVCRAWRNAALAISPLWSNICVPRWQTLPIGIDELLVLWLARAHRARLDINIRLFDEDEGRKNANCGHTERLIAELDLDQVSGRMDSLFEWHERTLVLRHLENFLRALAPHRGRIRRIKGGFQVGMLSLIGAREMFDVEAMDVTFYRIGETSQRHKLFEIGPARSTLKFLTVIGCSVELTSIIAQKQLTHLTLIHTGSDDCVDPLTAIFLLKLLPALKVVIFTLEYRFHKVAMIPPDPISMPTGNRFDLPTLETLVIERGLSEEHAGFVLDEFYTPNLRTLGTYGSRRLGDTTGQDWSSLCEFLTASRPPLRNITLSGFSHEQSLLQDCMHHCPDVEHFTIRFCEWIDTDTFRALTVTTAAVSNIGNSQTTSFLLPKLQCFTIRHCGYRLEDLVHFIKSRGVTNAPLGPSNLRFTEVSRNSSTPLQDFQALKRCGIETLIPILNGSRIYS